MDWPDHIEEEDDDFAEVLYTDEEAEALLREWSLRMQLASLKASEALKEFAEAARRCAEAVGRMRDNYVLAQEEVE